MAQVEQLLTSAPDGGIDNTVMRCLMESFFGRRRVLLVAVGSLALPAAAHAQRSAPATTREHGDTIWVTRGTHVVELVVRADTMKVRDIRDGKIAGDDIWIVRADSARRVGGGPVPVLTPAVARMYRKLVVSNRETQSMLNGVRPPG
jgi:hypothetical protein